VLQDIENSSDQDDISSYKDKTKNLFVQLLTKLEENGDQMYSLEHRVKFLEQECDSKDIHIEKITVAMQEAVDAAEEMVEEMENKVTVEINQRRDAEMIGFHLQTENTRLKDNMKLQCIPGLDRNLEDIMQQIREKEEMAFSEEVGRCREELRTKDKILAAVRIQREVEMTATLTVIRAAQQKIETLHHHMRVQEEREKEMRRVDKEKENDREREREKERDRERTQRSPVAPQVWGMGSFPSCSACVCVAYVCVCCMCFILHTKHDCTPWQHSTT
jgi:hypothetical protein